jgi:hypothetical protein
MLLVSFIEKALLKSIGPTRALIIIEATNKDSFAIGLESMLYKFKGSKTSIKIISVIGLNQIAGMVDKGTEETFNEIIDKLYDNSVFKSNNPCELTDFQKDVKILSLINKIKYASIGTIMLNKIDTLVIVNNLSHESIEIHNYKENILNLFTNYFNNELKIRIIKLIAQISRDGIEDISN